MTNLQLLQRAGQVEPMAPEILERAVAQLAGAVGADGADGACTAAGAHAPAAITVLETPAAAPSRHRVLRRLTVTAAAVATLAAGGVVFYPASSGPPPAGASELARLALTAADQPAPTAPGPGQYQYTSSVEAFTSSVLDGPHPYTDLVPETRQIWIGADGSGRIVESYGQATFLSPADQAAWVAAGSPNLAEAPSDQTFGPGQLSDGPTDLAKLPTDPSALAAVISSRKIEGGPPGPAEDFAQIGDLLRETDASPALRAALFTVAAGLPGIEELGTVSDHSGRAGVGVAFRWGGGVHELIFNPTDSSLMGEEDRTVASGQSEPAGTVDDWAVYLQSAVVDSDGATAASTPAPPSPSSRTAPQPAPGTA